MPLKSTKKIKLFQTINNFLEGNVTEESFIHFSKLLDKNYSSFDDLIPLLRSEHKYSQLAAVFIASFEGEQACVIFDEVKFLVNSPYWEVQEEACDCFISCGKNEDFECLVGLLNNSEQDIKMKVIQVFISIGYTKLISFLDYLSIEKPEITLLTELIKSFDKFEIFVSEHFNLINFSDPFNSTFLYILGVFEFSDIRKLEKLIRCTGNKDLNIFHEIYFIKDPNDDSCVPWNITSFSKNT